jgi:hypothetical protein
MHTSLSAEQNKTGWAYGMGLAKNGPQLLFKKNNTFDWLLNKQMLLIG